MRFISKFFLFLSCVAILAAPVRAEMVDRIIAKVGSSIIMQSDLARAIKMKRAFYFMKFKGAKASQLFNEFKKNTVNEMILDIILADQVVKNQVVVSDAEIDQELGIRMNNRGLDLMALQRLLKSYGVTLEDYKTLIRYDLEKQGFLQKVIVPNISISDYDLQKEYEKIKGEFLEYSELSFVEVFLIKEKFSSEQAMTQMAEKIRAQLKAGSVPKDLIKEYSMGAYASQGGISGLVKAKDLRPEISQILSRLKKNEVSQIMSVGPGVFIFKLLDKKNPSPMPFAKVVNVVRARFAEQVVEDELRRYLLNQKDQIYVEMVK